MSERVYAHFIGIGGAGMSGIARVLHERGVGVTGSDVKMSRYARSLTDAGVPVSIGHDALNLGDPEVVVVSSAIPETNPERVEARRRGTPVWQRARMLAHLAGDRRTVAVAGTHGKTTTSSMVATMLSRMGLDPTFLIGGEINDLGGNAHNGTGGHYVVEADESDGSFLELRPWVAVVTNVEADHLDHYGSMDEIERTFGEFLGRIVPGGVAIVCADDERLMRITRESGVRMLTYGRSRDADVRCDDAPAGWEFSVTLPDGRSLDARIVVPGRHNVLNATAALAVAHHLGLDVAEAAQVLSAFGGVRRRFEHVGDVDGVTVVDDYAHHPTEVMATLAAARTVGHDRVWVVFQPHRYSRTAALGQAFGSAFGDADRVVLMDVYGAGEAPVPGVSGKTVLDALLEADPRSAVAYFPHRGDVEPYLVSRVRPGDLVITMGAGDVTAVGGELVRALDEARTGVERACP